MTDIMLTGIGRAPPTPADVSDLYMWLDPADLETLWTSNSRVANLSDSAIPIDCAYVDDKSGNSNDFETEDPFDPILWVKQDGIRRWTNRGDNGLLKNTASTLSEPFTLYTAMIPTGHYPSAMGRYSVFRGHDNTASKSLFMKYEESGSSIPTALFGANAEDQSVPYSFSSLYQGSEIGKWLYVKFLRNTTVMEIDVITQQDSQSFTALNFQDDEFFLGDASIDFATCDFGDVIIIDRAVVDGEDDDVIIEEYLNTKYGITL